MNTFFINNEDSHMGKDYYRLAQALLAECAICFKKDDNCFKKDVQTVEVNLTGWHVTDAFKKAKLDFDLTLLDSSLDFLQLNLMYYSERKIIYSSRIEIDRNGFCGEGGSIVDVFILFSAHNGTLDDLRAEIIEKFLPKEDKPLKGYSVVFNLNSILKSRQKFMQEVLRLLLVDWSMGVNAIPLLLGPVCSVLIPSRHIIPAVKTTAKIDDDFCELVTDGEGLNDHGEADLSKFDLEEFEEEYLVECCAAFKTCVQIDYNGKRGPLFTDFEVVLTRTHRSSDDEKDAIEFEQDCRVEFTLNEVFDYKQLAKDVLNEDGNFQPNRLIDTD